MNINIKKILYINLIMSGITNHTIVDSFVKDQNDDIKKNHLYHLCISFKFHQSFH